MQSELKAQDRIRPVTGEDVDALKAIIDATQLFPSDMLNEMVTGYLSGTKPEEIWLTDAGDSQKTIAFCAPEKLTSGTWNLYLIAVMPDSQGQGHGKAMLHYLEQLLANRGERILLVETSGLPDFQRTRDFYRQNGYNEEARIREFYSAGEDKIIFRKELR